MARALRLLLVEDDADEARLVVDALRSGGFRVSEQRVWSPEDMRAALDARPFDAVVSDHLLPGLDAMTALGILREFDAYVPFIIVSAQVAEQRAVQAMGAGAHDYVMKGSLARLAPALERELAEADTRRHAGAAFEKVHMLAAIVESSNDAIIGMSVDGRITNWNKAARRMCRYDAEEVLGRPFEDLFPDEHRPDAQRLLSSAGAGELVEQHETVWIDRQGRLLDVSLTVSSIRDGVGGLPLGFSVIARDISERRRFEEQLRFLADHDPLTGLENRRRFEEELDRLVAFAHRYAEPLSLLVLDLDRFKFHNDTLGHSAGDDLIRGCARALRDRLRETDVLARLGGDEFAVLLPRTTLQDAHAVAEHLLNAVRQADLLVAGRVIRMTASIGVSSMDEFGATGAELLARADLAMFAAKDRGRDRAVASSPRDHMRLKSRIGWEQRIRDALANNLFTLHAQPIVDLARRRVSQHELLLRMTDGRGDYVPPAAFLPVAERTGLITDIDRWVARAAIRLAAEADWANHGKKLEVNLSGRSIDDPDLPEMIVHELERADVDPRRLVFEITETAAIANMDDAVRFARRLNKAGCGFALDDFGTGFGSFYYLKHLPLDYLKIDGDFIRELPRTPTDQVMVEAIQQVAHGLGLKTIAEFVGDDETVDLLRGYGVNYGQGYHLGRPVEISA